MRYYVLQKDTPQPYPEALEFDGPIEEYLHLNRQMIEITHEQYGDMMAALIADDDFIRFCPPESDTLEEFIEDLRDNGYENLGVTAQNRSEDVAATDNYNYEKDRATAVSELRNAGLSDDAIKGLGLI